MLLRTILMGFNPHKEEPAELAYIGGNIRHSSCIQSFQGEAENYLRTIGSNN